MMLSRVQGASNVCFTKRHLTIVTSTKNVLGGCFKTLGKEIDFIRIHGPTADEVTRDVDLTDKTCLLTGASGGIGLEMTRCLLARNCTTLAVCRNLYEAGGALRSTCDNQHLLRLYKTNLASLKSVKNTSDELVKLDRKIDIVILNAGVFGLPWTITEDGLETTFEVNYLSQYYLLTNIENMLAPDARVVFVSSESHRNIKWSLNNILAPTIDSLSLPKDEYTSIRAYNVSKLCGILAMHYLGYRWLNTSKQVFCAHPGSFVKTKLCRNWWVYEALYTTMKPFSKTIAQAASTPLYCATSPELKGLSALYFKDCKRCEESELAKDFQLAFRVQDLTFELLRNRTAPVMETLSQYREQSKDTENETLVSNYSG
ncbi:unnamed protein product [Chilo suppressalis]|uniref:WW domain-containing oxidoreductase n=1 Tax=Chilo suppressalis TaxID=168631 RepID=A0ABN8B8Q0_CHISP|nr:hypothetical protein evm_010195 [Chilo suppressalis]CAH0404887.1 unnamed protein product [Chilo suppressalis]